MALTPTQWHQGNKTMYLETTSGSTTDFSVDLYNVLDTGDTLSTVTPSTTSSNLTFDNVTVYADSTQNRTAAHQIVGFLTPATADTHDVKLIITTTQGKTFVYHFDVYAKQ